MSDKRTKPKKIYRDRPEYGEIEPTQIEKFKEAAREVETDDREEAFDAIVKKIAKSPTQEGDPPKKAQK